MKGSLLRSGALRAFGRIGRRRRLCTSQPGAAAAAAWAELQDEARAALSTPAYARFGMDRFIFGEVLTHGSLAEALAHELGSKFTANDTDKQVRFEELLHLQLLVVVPDLPDLVESGKCQDLVVLLTDSLPLLVLVETLVLIIVLVILI